MHLIDLKQGSKLETISLAGINLQAETISFGNSIYMMGGKLVDDIFMIQKGGQKKLCSKLSKPKYCMGISLIDGNIILAGGYNQETELKDVEEYIVSSSVCRNLPSLLHKRRNPAVVVDSHYIYVIGGCYKQNIERLERAAFKEWTDFNIHVNVNLSDIFIGFIIPQEAKEMVLVGSMQCYTIKNYDLENPEVKSLYLSELSNSREIGKSYPIFGGK